MKNYSRYDIVIPLVGGDTRFDDRSIVDKVYLTLLKEDDLSIDDFRNIHE